MIKPGTRSRAYGRRAAKRPLLRNYNLVIFTALDRHMHRQVNFEFVKEWLVHTAVEGEDFRRRIPSRKYIKRNIPFDSIRADRDRMRSNI